MERFNQGDNVIVGYRHPKSFEGSENARYSNSEMDFNDVFGGPPKRYSMQEMRMRYSFSETIDSEDDNPVFSTRGDPSRSDLNEKPVFGEESVNRRRYNKTGDFFDDIFKGDESYGSPRRSDRDPFGSAPGSRVLSPARPLPPPEAEVFGNSLPAHFSLPAKLTTTIDSPVFGSSNSLPDKNMDGISNELSTSQIPKPLFSKFLNRSNSGKKETKGDRQFYRQSLLSREASLASEESPLKFISDGNDKGSGFKEDPVDGSQFHFSIYKWPGGGVPLMTSLWVGKNSRLEETSKNERLSSSNGSIGSNSLNNGRSESDNMDNVLRNAEPESSEVEKEQNDTGINQQETELHMKYANREAPESKLLNDMKNPAVLSTEERQSSNRVGIQEKLIKEVLTNVVKPEMKPLLSDIVDAKGKSDEENGNAAKKGPINHKEKKNDTKRKTLKKELAKKDSVPGSPMKNSPGKTGVKGKVTEFVKIFNQESTRKTKIDVDKRSESSRWKKSDNYGIDNEGSNVIKVNENMESSKVDYTPKAAFSKVDETPKEDTMKQPETPYKDTMKQPSNIKTSDHKSSRLTDQKDSSSFRASSHGTSKATSENSEDHFHESFSVEEISQDQDKVSQTSGDPEDIRASDAKIQQWSNGRKGNIRSLLSTLQLVLWPESGWKPVPLVNIIEGNSVKRAYQRALLCLHPDKLQQKDASFLQKYIAEKVFDILQEAWDHFNSLGAV